MRASLFCAAAAVALAVTAFGPGQAQAQIVFSFGGNNPGVYSPGFVTPAYGYGTNNFVTPAYYGNSYYRGWNTPYSAYSWSNRAYPTYGYGTSSWNGYRGNYGVNRGFFRRW